MKLEILKEAIKRHRGGKMELSKFLEHENGPNVEDDEKDLAPDVKGGVPLDEENNEELLAQHKADESLSDGSGEGYESGHTAMEKSGKEPMADENKSLNPHDLMKDMDEHMGGSRLRAAMKHMATMKKADKKY